MRYIYKITNLINNKCYIGQTSNFRKRKREHIAGDYNSLIYQAICKYGINSFTFEILAECSDNLIDAMEVHTIKYYNSIAPNGYNLESGGSVHKTHNEITKKKISDKNKGKKFGPHSQEWKDKIAKINEERKKLNPPKEKVKKDPHWRKGRKLSEATKRKMSESSKHIKLSPEHIEKLRRLNTGKIMSQEIKDKIAKTLKGRPSPKKGIKMTDAQRQKLSLAHKGHKPTQESINKRLQTMRNKGLIK